MSPAEILTRVQELRFKLIQLMYLSFNANVKSRDIAQYKGDKIDLNLWFISKKTRYEPKR